MSRKPANRTGGGKTRTGRPANRVASTGPGRARSTTPANRRPLGPRPQRVPTGPATPARQKLEHASVGPLNKLKRLPRWTIPALMGLLLLGGLLIPSPLAGLLLLLLAGFLAWLVALSWPVLPAGARWLRVAVVAVVTAAAVWRLSGRG